MKALLLEPIGGICGDMFLAVAAELGVDLQALARLLGGFGLSGFSIDVEPAAQHEIHGTRVTVRLAQTESHSHRAWADIKTLLGKLPPSIAATAGEVFGALAKVEGHIHGVPEAEVEFHEVGAIDSIVDIIGAAFALEALGSPKLYTRPPPLGSGTIRGQHGVIPLPAPATLALLQGKPTLLEGRGELTTPTGAALLATLAEFRLPASLTPERIAYGIGHAVFDDRPNVLRAVLGTVAPAESASSNDHVLLMEAHLDDATPQLLAYLCEQLLAAGALDAALSPLLMKKGRVGHRLTVVARAHDRAALTNLIFRESTTLGLRISPVEREELERRLEEVETPWGTVRVKVASHLGQVVNRAPEYEDCAALARKCGVPLKDVLAAALRAGKG